MSVLNRSLPGCCAIFTPRPDRTSCLCTMILIGFDRPVALSLEGKERLHFRNRVELLSGELGSGLVGGTLRISADAVFESAFCGD